MVSVLCSIYLLFFLLLYILACNCILSIKLLKFKIETYKTLIFIVLIIYNPNSENAFELHNLYFFQR